MNGLRLRAAGCAAMLCIGIAGCALKPSWHWEKRGASDQEYSFDLNQCKAAVYSYDTSGVVTSESVRRMSACMERKGWSRVEN